MPTYKSKLSNFNWHFHKLNEYFIQLDNIVLILSRVYEKNIAVEGNTVRGLKEGIFCAWKNLDWFYIKRRNYSKAHQIEWSKLYKIKEDQLC